MPEFQLPGRDAPQFEALNPFIQGYIEAMFWTEVCHGDEFTMARWDDPETKEAVEEGTSDGNLPSDAGFDQLHPDAIADIIVSCAAFQMAAGVPLMLAYERDYSEEQAGHDFWLTRNGHGTGFWDRKELEPEGPEWRSTQVPIDEWTPALRELHARLEAESLGRQLTRIAKELGEPQVWFGDHVQHGDAPFVYHD